MATTRPARTADECQQAILSMDLPGEAKIAACIVGLDWEHDGDFQAKAAAWRPDAEPVYFEATGGSSKEALLELAATIIIGLPVWAESETIEIHISMDDISDTKAFRKFMEDEKEMADDADSS